MAERRALSEDPTEHQPVPDQRWDAKAFDWVADLGRYVPIESIGRGGMGEVIRAYDPKLCREVALKRVRPGRLSDDDEQRLVIEAQAMARLSHPNVVAVHDLEVRAGQVFVAMELVRGETLYRWLQRDPPASEVLDMFRQAGRGLAAAHAAGIVHRDFKPSNVLVAEDGRARVTDFGLAEFTQFEETAEDASTNLSMSGTPRYMSPEHHAGDETDSRTDQYSFCVALWFALTKEAPFTGSPERLEDRKRAGPPAWPGVAGIPKEIGAAIRRGLAPLRDDRWGSMEELLDHLRFDPHARRRRAVRWAVAGSMAALASTAAWALGRDPTDRCSGGRDAMEQAWNPSVARRAGDGLRTAPISYGEATWERVEPRLNAYAEAWVAGHTDACEATNVRAEQSTEALDLRMGCLHRAKIEFVSLVSVFEEGSKEAAENAIDLVVALPALQRCSDLQALRARVPPPSDPEIARRVRETYDRLAETVIPLKIGRGQSVRPALETLLVTAESLGYGPLQAAIEDRLAAVAAALGEYDRAVQMSQHALSVAVESGDDDLAAELATRLATLLGKDLARFDAALLAGDHGLALSRRLDDPTRISGALNALGLIYFNMGRFEDAIETHTRSDEITATLHEPDHPERGIAALNRAMALEALGRFAEAEAAYRRSLQIWTKAYGELHPHVAAAYMNLGAVMARQRRNDEALGYYRKALELRRELVGDNHPSVGDIEGNIGSALLASARFEEARPHLEAAERLHREGYGVDHPFAAASRGNLAALWIETGEAARAADTLLEVEASLRESVGDRHPFLFEAMVNRADALLRSGRPAEARTLAEQLVAAIGDEPGMQPLVAHLGWLRAQALDTTPAGRADAVAQATAARDAFAAAGPHFASEVEEVEAWLRQRRGPADPDGAPPHLAR